MSNFCIKCGAQLKADSKFCSACGTKVVGENSNQPPMPYESQECYEGFTSPSSPNQNAGLYVKFYDTFLKKDGRLNRWRYFKRALIVNIFFAIPFLPLNSYSDKELENLLPELSLFILVVCGLQIYFLYCLNVRRLHDLNYNAADDTLFRSQYVFIVQTRDCRFE
ncbi:MAG: zinc-ribbon domain-containing protein [Selenomonadaceae bacterium]|nr:zinc-ribbon domain-containing protein [Selenomonadaceae bacterium]